MALFFLRFLHVVVAARHFVTKLTRTTEKHPQDAIKGGKFRLRVGSIIHEPALAAWEVVGGGLYQELRVLIAYI
jgi:hypothetical protein